MSAPAPIEVIVEEARRIASENGVEPNDTQLYAIVRDTRRYVEEGMDWREATDLSATVAFRLYGKPPPWA